MKKIILIVAGLFFFAGANAQYLTDGGRKAKDSLIDATTKTLTWSSTRNNVQSVKVSFVNATGTTAGYALLQTRVDTVAGANEWVRVVNSDTAFITNGNTHIWNLTNAGLGHYGNGYRVVFYPSGTQKTYVYAALLRR